MDWSRFLLRVVETASSVARGRPDPGMVDGDTESWLVALAIAFVSAVSGMVAHAGFLAINRVQGRRLVAAAVLAFAQLLVALAFQGVVLWLCLLPLGEVMSVGTIVRVVLLSTAPLWWGAIAIAPYVGPLVGRVLWAWTLIALVGQLGVLLPWERRWQIVLVVAVAWLAARLAAALVDPPVQWVRRRVWRSVMGAPMVLSIDEQLVREAPVAVAQKLAPPGRDLGRRVAR